MKYDEHTTERFCGSVSLASRSLTVTAHSPVIAVPSTTLPTKKWRCSALALARWHHPERGILTPGAFQRAVTEIGKIDQINRLILEDSLNAIARLNLWGIQLPSLAVNVSEARLADPKLCKDIERLWRNKSCQLTLELLETAYFDDTDATKKFTGQLERLRDLGVRIETDGFGSGRASITGLIRLAPDGIKIDPSLTQKVVWSPKQRSVVGGILEIARALNIECLAEGVETQEDIETIIALGCNRFQGYAICHPVSEQDLIEFFRLPVLFQQNKQIDDAAGVLIRQNRVYQG